LAGLEIVHSPLAVHVTPQLVHLPTCVVEWAGSNKGRAGAPLKFAVQAFDARGNRIENGGETLWYEVLHEDRVVAPKAAAVDQGQGCYEGVVCLEEVSAVPYQVQLTLAEGDGPVKQFPVSCSPADTHFPQCVVDVRDTLQLTAGAWGSFSILRNDRFGNAVVRLPLDCTHPGLGPRVSVFLAGGGGRSGASPPRRPLEDGLADPADTSRSDLAAALALLSRWRHSKFWFGFGSSR
jgi:hypothetical protein